jgi:hypothetical protein
MTLSTSQIATLRNVNERPGKLSVAAIGADYASALETAGYVMVRNGRVHPTAKAAPYVGRSAAALRDAEQDARSALLGRWGASL